MRDRKANNKKKNTPAQYRSDGLIDFVIITAVEVERKAVCRVFGLKDRDRVDKGTRRYWRGKLRLRGGGYYEIVVAQLSDMANVDATALTVDAGESTLPVRVYTLIANAPPGEVAALALMQAGIVLMPTVRPGADSTKWRSDEGAGQTWRK